MVKVISPRDWRRNSGLTLAQVATKVATKVGIRGKNPSRTLQRWESGEADPPLRIVAALETLSEGRVTLRSWPSLEVCAPNGASGVTTDSTSSRADDASPYPNPEIPGSPAADAGVGAGAVDAPADRALSGA